MVGLPSLPASTSRILVFSSTKVREVRSTDSYALPFGLPPRLCAGKSGFDTLCGLLGIASSKQKHAIVDASFVRHVLKTNGHTLPRQTKTAERLRLSLLAVYQDPEVRRTIWRHYRGHEDDGNSATKAMPSLEHAALTRYDGTVVTADPDPDALAECAAFHRPDVGEEDWRTPALVALPRLRADIADWASLPRDKQMLVLDAALATATLLDDARLLEWAVEQSDDIADQYAFAVAQPRRADEIQHRGPDPTNGTPEIQSEPDVLATLHDRASELGDAAAGLAEQPTGVLFDEVASLAAEVAALRESVLERTAVDIVGNLIDEYTTFLRDGSNRAPWLGDHADEVITVWRSAHATEAGPNVDRLRDDLSRAEAEVRERLAHWADAEKGAADANAALGRHNKAMAAKDFPSLSDVETKVALTAEVQSRQELELDAMRQVVEAAKPKLGAAKPFDSDAAGASESLTAGPMSAAGEPEHAEPGKATKPQPQTEKMPHGDQVSLSEKPTNGNIETRPAACPTASDAATGVAPPVSGETSIPSDPESVPSDRGTDHTVVPDSPTDPELNPQKDDGVVVRRPTKAIWDALGNRRTGLAYQIARLDASDSDLDCPSAELLAAVALGTVVRGPDDDLANEYGRRINALPELDLTGTSQPIRDALNLLLLCASLRPALLASQQGIAIPLLRRVELSVDLTPVYRLAGAVADEAEKLQGVHLDVPTLAAILDEAVWHDRLEAHFGDVARWRSTAAAATFLYQPAGVVWRRWLADGGILAELASLISTDRVDNTDRVNGISNKLASRRSLASLIENTRRGGRGRSITGRALSQFESRLATLLELVDAWRRIIAAKPDGTGRTGAAVERLRRNVDELAPAARSAIERVQRASPELPLASALTCALGAITLLQGILRREPDRGLEIGPTEALSDDLLLVPELRVDPNGDIEKSMSPEAALALMLDADAHAKTLTAAFDARLEQGDLHGAYAVCKRMATEADPKEDICRERLNDVLNQERQRFRRELEQFVQMLEQAFIIGEIADDRRADLTAAIADTTRRLADPDQALRGVRDFAVIKEQVTEPHAAGVSRLKAKLEPYLPLEDPRERALVDSALDAGDLTTLHEQLDCLEAGQPLVSPHAGERTHLAAFNTVAERFAEELRGDEDPSQNALVGAASRREDIVGLSFSSLSPAQSEESVTLLESWFLMSRHRKVEPQQLAHFFAALGFTLARNPVRVRNSTSAIISTEPLRARELCPVHPFGSDANGRYDIALDWSASARESIIQGIGNNPNAHTFVLHFARLSRDDREWLRRWSIKYSAQFVTIDETLVLHLATLPGGTLRALFECTLPFTCVEPFFTAPGLVPPESFFGRESERRAIMDRYGTCFVYGGRQLGKTALLHACESAFHDPDSNRLALYVDLKVHDIGIAHGADHIWQVLWPLLSNLDVIAEGSMPRSKDGLVNAVTESVDRWLRHDDECRILLLLDEADAFLADDIKTDFSVSTRLKGLMDETHRKFKVVLCGLHNVLRNTERANHPLAHFGEPICVGPLLGNGDLQHARALIRDPMGAVGYTLANENLLTQILVWTNYYPSLIQIYGEALLRYVRQSSNGEFPRAITADDIKSVFDRDQFRDWIRDRFSLTLQLDPRYEVIAYAMAYELLAGDANVFSRGLASRTILDLAKAAWAEGFDTTEREFGTLLQEMCGLGVLRQRSRDPRQTPSYVFRNPNVLLLLGDTENIEEVLLKDRDLPDVFDGSAFHGHYTQERAPSARRGPLTYEQESLVKRGGRIAILGGTRAADARATSEFLKQRMDIGLVRPLEPCMDDRELTRQLNALRPVGNTHIYFVGEDDPWTLHWIERTADVLHRARRGTALRVVFPADPDQLWRFVTELPDEFLEDASGLFDWVAAQPWTAAFLRHWASDQNLHEASTKIDELLELTGGWPLVLERFAGSGEKTWEAKASSLQDYISANTNELLDALGLAKNVTRSQMAILRDCGTLSPDDVEDYAALLAEDGGHVFEPGVMRRRLFWTVQLGLVVDVGGSLSLNPLVDRVLRDADA